MKTGAFEVGDLFVGDLFSSLGGHRIETSAASLIRGRKLAQ
jgi:hypothetical protein